MNIKNNKDFAAIHAYLCADGYVITNPNGNGHKYYYAGLRNMNLTLLQDFHHKCKKVFEVSPIITKELDRCKIQNKELVLKLLNKFGSFHSDKWTMPIMSKPALSVWLRAYFDCDGWVGFVARKDRKVGLASINYPGIRQIQKKLKSVFDIESKIAKHTNKNIYDLTICGKDDLEKFQKDIGFLHPKKANKLQEALESYVDLNWTLPQKVPEFLDFVREKARINTSRKEVRMNSIIKNNLAMLQNKLLKMGIKSRLNGPWTNSYGSKWFCLSMRLEDFHKLERR